MRLAFSLLGTEVLAIEFGPQSPKTSGSTTASRSATQSGSRGLRSPKTSPSASTSWTDPAKTFSTIPRLAMSRHGQQHRNTPVGRSHCLGLSCLTKEVPNGAI